MPARCDQPHVRLESFTPDPALLRLVPEEMARSNMAAPLWMEEDSLVLVTASPTLEETRQVLEKSIRRKLILHVTTLPEINIYLDHIYQSAHLPGVQLSLEFIFEKLGTLNKENLNRALQEQKSEQHSLALVLYDMGLIKEDDLAEACGIQYSMPHLRSENLKSMPALAGLIPLHLAQLRSLIPLQWVAGSLEVGISSLAKENPAEAVRLPLNLPCHSILCPPVTWQRAYNTAFLRGTIPARDVEILTAEALLRKKVLTKDELSSAQALSRQTGLTLADTLVNLNLVGIQTWRQEQARITGLRHRSLEEAQDVNMEPSALSGLLPRRLAVFLGVIPIGFRKETLVLGMKVPSRIHERLVEAITGCNVEPHLLDEDDFQTELNRVYDGVHDSINPPVGTRLRDLLLKFGYVTIGQLKDAETAIELDGSPLGEKLLELGLISDLDLAEVLSLQTGIPYAGLDHALFDPDLINQIPRNFIQNHLMIPFFTCGEGIWLAISDPYDTAGILEMESTFGLRVHPIIAPQGVIKATLGRFLASEMRVVDASLQKFVNSLVTRQLLTQAQAAIALQMFTAEKIPLDTALVRACGRTSMECALVMAEVLDLPLETLHLEETTVTSITPLGEQVTRQEVIDPVEGSAARFVSLETAMRLGVLPIRREDDELVVAFADPLYASARQFIEDSTGLKVKPVLVSRTDLEEAIQRILGRKNIGTYLLLEGLITRSQLNDALDLAQRTGVRLGRALLNRGYITEKQIYKFLAKQAGLPFVHLVDREFDPEVTQLIDPETCQRLGILPLEMKGGKLVLAMVDPFNSEALETATRITGKKIKPVFVTGEDMSIALDRLHKDAYLSQSVSRLLERSPEDSAFRVLSKGQKISLLLFALLSIAWLILDYRSYLIVINALFTVFYLAFSAYKVYLVSKSVQTDLEVPVTNREIAALKDNELPFYTLLIPVYREAEILPGLFKALEKLDYPSTKLDIKILMEADDPETIKAFHLLNPPIHFQPIVVPVAQPKTKPKACNYGLIHARGEFIVIFDAEDIPDPDQLKRAVVAFSKVPKNVVCLQAKLNYYNRSQNLLTQWFTSEYSMWFDLVLPGLDATRAPIPLGGTSNHFRTAALVEAGAWDPYNVTEDADLGIRLFKRGYRTAIIDSTTYEEANSTLYNWIRQRSRWLKGYIQTWLVHMRHPFKLLHDVGWPAFMSFQMIVGGTVVTALLNPVYWLLTTLWFLIEWKFVQSLFPGVVFFFGLICLFVGNFAFTYVNVAGALKRNYHDAVRYALLSPLYWGLMSVGAWKGFIQLIQKPHFWEKTIHGLPGSQPSSQEQADESESS